MSTRRIARGARSLVLLGFALAVPGGCGGGAGAADGGSATLLVSAAASLSEAIGEIAERYEEKRDVRVRLNVAGSQMLASQIIEGAPVDVFISADALQMERAAAAGRIEPSQRVDLLSNQLVIVVPSDRAGTVTGPRDLANASIARIALGDPEAVPAGVYARRYLESEGLWERLSARIVPAGSVRAALRAVEAGDGRRRDRLPHGRRTAPVGRGHRVRGAAREAGPTIVYPAAVLRDAPTPAAAARFLEHLRGDAARRRLRGRGLRPPAAGGGECGA